MTYGIGKPVPMSARHEGTTVCICEHCKAKGKEGYVMPPDINPDYIKCPHCGAFFNKNSYCFTLPDAERISIYN